MHTIYGIRLEMEYRNDFDDSNNYDTSFKVLDAYDYSSISTIDVKRSLYDLSVNGNGSLIALVEDQPSYEAKPETFVKIYCVGMKKTEQDEEVCDMSTENVVNNSSSNQLPNLSRLYENVAASDGGMGRTTGREGGASISLFGTTAASGNGGVGGHAAPRPRAAGGVNDVGVGNGGGGGVNVGNGGVGGGGNANALEARNANQVAVRWHGNNIEIVPPYLVGQRQRQSQIQPQPLPRNHHHHQQNRNHNSNNNNNNNRDAGRRAALEPDTLAGAGDGGGGGGRVGRIGRAGGNGGAGAAQANVNNDLNDLFDLDDIAINLLSLLVGR